MQTYNISLIRRTYLCLIGVAIATSSFAQWSNGTHINNTNTGNVGINIGTTTPILPLTVGDAAGIVQKNSPTPYFLIKGGMDTYLQTVASAGTNWTRAAVSTNIHWNNSTNNWRVDGGAYSDFSSMNFENAGNIAFYTRNTTGSSYDLSHSGLATFKRLTISNDGIVSILNRLGIGTAAPISSFQVGDGSNFLSVGSAGSAELKYGTSYIGFNAARNGGNWSLRGDGANNGGGVIYSNISGEIFFVPIARTGTGQQTLTDLDVKNKTALVINYNGNVGIGTPTPDQKLSVNGTIHTKKVVVDNIGWSDYVFKPEYRLPLLSEVRKYIEQNQHLPDIPSEAELNKTGIDVTEMLKLQMKKIEELTLYLIEKEKQVEVQEARIKRLEGLVIKQRQNK